MVEPARAQLMRAPENTQRSTFLELFFDLVFAFALTRLADGLIHDLRWSDVLEAGILLPAVWWVWTPTDSPAPMSPYRSGAPLFFTWALRGRSLRARGWRVLFWFAGSGRLVDHRWTGRIRAVLNGGDVEVVVELHSRTGAVRPCQVGLVDP